MSYVAVDQTIRDWVAVNGLTLFVESSGAEARFCYFSSPQGECYQISVDPPENDLVKVHVSAVETVDDMEAHLEWVVHLSDLRAALDTAEKTVREYLWRRQPLRPSEQT
jgi:hypothetical protein